MVRPNRLLYLIAVLPASLLMAFPAWAVADPSSEVELECKLENGTGVNPESPVIVELKDIKRGDVRISTGIAGESIHFKSLKPGIYSFCAWLKMGAPVCRTFDLRIPGTLLGRVFTRIFRLTSKMKRNRDLLQVSRIRLATPSEAVEELRKSRDAYKRGEEELMVEHLLRAIEIYPQYVDAMNNLATCYIHRGKMKQAEDYLKRATSLDPGFYAAWVNLAVCLLSQGNMAESVKAGLNAVKIRPDSAAANSVVGRAYFYMNKYSEAKKYLRKHLSIDPEALNSSQLVLYQIALADRNYREADMYLSEYLKLHPHAPDVPFLLRIQQWVRSRIQ